MVKKRSFRVRCASPSGIRQVEPERVAGAEIWRSFLSRVEQEALLGDLGAVIRQAPLFAPETRWGKKMSVQITSAGALGWISDRRGYRYEPRHPTGVRWPAIPASVLAVWRKLANTPLVPDSCLINVYGEGARMGLHQDRDEARLTHPVLSISLGDDALFRIGGMERRSPTLSRWLHSGDVLLLTGASRLAYHGIDRIRHGSSPLIEEGGRMNLTLRVAG